MKVIRNRDHILRVIHLGLGMYLARESDKEFNRIVNVEKYDRWDKTPGGELRKIDYY